LPITKSAKKQVRKDEKRRLHNRSIRSLCRTNVVKAGRLIASGELDLAREAVAIATSSLDKAAEKRVIHPNNAARRKARLMKKLNQALSS
jgi:small subunit ribosomal protein S20